MSYWKQILGRLALSTASLTIIGTLGGFLGAIVGTLAELMLQALFDLAISPLTVIPIFTFLGLFVSLIWGLTVLVQNRPAARITPPGSR